MADTRKNIHRWTVLMSECLKLRLTMQMVTAAATHLHKPWQYLRSKMIVKSLAVHVGLDPTPPPAPLSKEEKKSEINKYLQLQKTRQHQQLGKTAIDGRGSNDTKRIRTCRICMMRWEWVANKWVQTVNPKLVTTNKEVNRGGKSSS